MLGNSIVAEVKMLIEKNLRNGKRKFIIYPFGDVGMLVKRILNEVYAVTEIIVLDNHLCKYNPNIKSTSCFQNMDRNSYGIILASTNLKLYRTLKSNLLEYVDEREIDEIPSIKSMYERKTKGTKCGKYSYGPLCNHTLVESVGAFCSFANGTNVVLNHPLNYISTHDMLYRQDNKMGNKEAEEYYIANASKYYPAGLIPTGYREIRRITIGNDVWLGQNVLVTNYANIGNGVIAGAGAVITKDVPDYAVVAGVPARIIRYRYTREQIEKLNQIQWWNWSDEEIKEKYDDFL